MSSSSVVLVSMLGCVQASCCPLVSSYDLFDGWVPSPRLVGIEPNPGPCIFCNGSPPPFGGAAPAGSTLCCDACRGSGVCPTGLHAAVDMCTCTVDTPGSIKVPPFKTSHLMKCNAYTTFMKQMAAIEGAGSRLHNLIWATQQCKCSRDPNCTHHDINVTKDDLYQLRRGNLVRILALWEQLLTEVLKEAWRVIRLEYPTWQKLRESWNRAALHSVHQHSSFDIAVGTALADRLQKYLQVGAAAVDPTLAEDIDNALNGHLRESLRPLSIPFLRAIKEESNAGFANALTQLFDLRPTPPSKKIGEMRKEHDACEEERAQRRPEGSLYQDPLEKQRMKEFIDAIEAKREIYLRRSHLWSLEYRKWKAQDSRLQREKLRLDAVRQNVRALKSEIHRNKSARDPDRVAQRETAEALLGKFSADCDSFGQEHKRHTDQGKLLPTLLLPCIGELHLSLTYPLQLRGSAGHPYEWDCILKGGGRTTIILDDDAVAHDVLRLVYGIRCTFAHGSNERTLDGAMLGLEYTLPTLQYRRRGNPREAQAWEYLIRLRDEIEAHQLDYTLRHNEWVNMSRLVEKLGHLCINQVRRVVKDVFALQMWTEHKFQRQ